MKLSDLVDTRKEEQLQAARKKRAKDRQTILRDLRRGLSEEEYAALAAELRPRVEGYALVWKGWEIILSTETGYTLFGPTQRTRATYAGGRFSLGWSKKIRNGRDLLEFLAEVK